MSSFFEKVYKFFGFDSINESYFVDSTFVSQDVLLLIRSISLLGGFVTCLCSIIFFPLRWYFFFTNLSYLGILIYLFLVLLVTLLVRRKKKVSKGLLIMTCIAYELPLTAHVIVPLVYWIILAPNDSLAGAPGYRMWVLISMHGGDFLMMLAEFMVNRVPLYFSHLIFLVILTWVYIFWSMVAYAIENGWWVYGFLDFSTPYVAASYIGLNVAVALVHSMWCGWQRLKDKFCFPTKEMITQASQAHLNSKNNNSVDMECQNDEKDPGKQENIN